MRDDNTIINDYLNRPYGRPLNEMEVRVCLVYLVRQLNRKKSLAYRIGISHSTLSQTISGRVHPNEKVLKFLKLKKVVMYQEIE
jgi:hypothetical protein